MSQPKRRSARKFENAVNALAHQLGRAPSEEELANHMEISLDEVQRRRHDAQEYRFVPADHGEINDLRVTLSEMSMDPAVMRVMVREALEKVDERARTILMLYYFHDMNMREIGKVLELTEARICQLHKSAVSELQAYLVASDSRVM